MSPEALCHWVPWDGGVGKRKVSCTSLFPWKDTVPSLESEFSHSWVDQKDSGRVVDGDLKASISCFPNTKRHFTSATIANFPENAWW